MKTYNKAYSKEDSTEYLLQTHNYIYRLAVLTRRMYISSVWRSVHRIRTLHAVVGSEGAWAASTGVPSKLWHRRRQGQMSNLVGIMGTVSIQAVKEKSTPDV
jgi:hypothetical protein